MFSQQYLEVELHVVPSYTLEWMYFSIPANTTIWKTNRDFIYLKLLSRAWTLPQNTGPCWISDHQKSYTCTVYIYVYIYGLVRTQKQGVGFVYTSHRRSVIRDAHLGNTTLSIPMMIRRRTWEFSGGSKSFVNVTQKSHGSWQVDGRWTCQLP